MHLIVLPPRCFPLETPEQTQNMLEYPIVTFGLETT